LLVIKWAFHTWQAGQWCAHPTLRMSRPVVWF